MSLDFPLLSVNGVYGAAISPLDRGFAYGDGVFETCRYHQGEIPLWEFHRARLLASAARLNIPVDESLLEGYLAAVRNTLASAAVRSATLKIQITRGVGGRGYRVPTGPSLQPTYFLGAFPVDSLRSSAYLQGVDVRLCAQPVSRNQALAGMKHLNRLEQILARAEWQDEYAEGLLMDSEGRVIEGTVSNVFLVKAGCLYTPDLTEAGVAGVMRRTIIERLAPSIAVPVVVEAIDEARLREADELFVCNSVYGIWPVNVLIDDRHGYSVLARYSQQGVTRQLQAALECTFKLLDE